MKKQTSVTSKSMGRRMFPDLDQRTLSVLDIENLAGEALPSSQVVGRIREWLLSQEFSRAGRSLPGRLQSLRERRPGCVA